ncbi:MAG: hypothetical protein ACJA0H_000222 [Francisellaceae bacterium]
MIGIYKNIKGESFLIRLLCFTNLINFSNLIKHSQT